MRANFVETPPFPAESGPTNADIMTKLDRMMNAMALKEDVQVAQMEVVKQLRSEFSSQFEPLRTQVEATTAAVSRARDETKSLNDRLVKVETIVADIEQGHGSGTSDARFAFDPNDASLRRISILGIESGDADIRVQTIEGWMAKEFPNVRIIDVGNYYQFSDGSKSLKISQISYIEVSNKDVRNAILDKIASKPALKIAGKSTTFKPGLTQVAMARNGALRAAAEEIANDKRFEGMTIKRETGKEDRGVTANGVYIFQQNAHGPGSFKPPYGDLKLPERRGRRP